jgi:sulfide:quinone oxidoreductase
MSYGHGHTAALMRAKPLFPPNQESELKDGVRYKWGEITFERYFLWKIKHGLSNLP